MRHGRAIICLSGCLPRKGGHAAGRSSRHRKVEGRFGGGGLIPERVLMMLGISNLNSFVGFISRFSDQKLPK